MTVNLEIPFIRYIGNGSTVSFAFNWSSDEQNEMYVERNGNALRVGVDYDIEEYETENGGLVRFYEPPAQDDIILIYRETPVTQQVDYTAFDAFPADTHESQMDKDTRILQEIIEGGRGIGGPANLTAIQEAFQVIIDNSAGENATIRMWNCAGDKAGVFAGEVVDADNLPTNGDSTDKPDGYFWFFLEQTDIGVPIPPDPGDPPGTPTYSIVLPVGSFTAGPVNPTSSQQTELIVFRNNANKGQLRYGARGESQTTRDIIRPRDFGAGRFWYRHIVESGGANVINPPSGQWEDLYAPNGALDETFNILVEDGGSVVFNVEVAPDDGSGSPDTSNSVFSTFTLTAGTQAGTPPPPDPGPEDVTNIPIVPINIVDNEWGPYPFNENGVEINFRSEFGGPTELQILQRNVSLEQSTGADYIPPVSPLFVAGFEPGPNEFFVRFDTTNAEVSNTQFSPTNEWVDFYLATAENDLVRRSWTAPLPTQFFENNVGVSANVSGTIRWCQGKNGAPDLTTEYSVPFSFVANIPVQDNFTNMSLSSYFQTIEAGVTAPERPFFTINVLFDGKNDGVFVVQDNVPGLGPPIRDEPFLKTAISGPGEVFVRVSSFGDYTPTGSPRDVWLDVFDTDFQWKAELPAGEARITWRAQFEVCKGSGGSPDETTTVTKLFQFQLVEDV